VTWIQFITKPPGICFTEDQIWIAKFYPANTPHIEKICQNFERYAEEMILQIACIHPLPWEKSLSAFIDVIKGEKLSWWLAGSAVLAVRGMAISPGDLDIAGGVLLSVDKPHINDYGPTAAQRLEAVRWQEETLSVPPLDLLLQVSKRRGLTERVKKIEPFLSQRRS
jgi:hypothetical protein